MAFSSPRLLQDGEYVRLTYLLDDMEPEGGGTAFFAGSHRAAAREGDRLVDNANAEGGVGSGVPEWLNAPGPAGHGPGTWVPVDAPGVWRAEGPAGSVIINYVRHSLRCPCIIHSDRWCPAHRR